PVHAIAETSVQHAGQHSRVCRTAGQCWLCLQEVSTARCLSNQKLTFSSPARRTGTITWRQFRRSTGSLRDPRRRIVPCEQRHTCPQAVKFPKTALCPPSLSNSAPSAEHPKARP